MEGHDNLKTHARDLLSSLHMCKVRAGIQELLTAEPERVHASAHPSVVEGQAKVAARPLVLTT
jgi:hypothetical protein